MSSDFHPIGLTGASGKLGTMILRELLEVHNFQPSKIIAITRTPDKLSELSKKGVQVRQGDFDDPDSLKKAFIGINRLLIIPGTEYGKRLQQNTTAIKEAAAAGVKHIMYSGMVSPPQGVHGFPPDHYETEDVLKSTIGISWTILGFGAWNEMMPMIYGTWLKMGTLYTTCAAGTMSIISEEDSARAAAVALVSSSTAINSKYEISGQVALDRGQIVAILSNALALPKSIQVLEVSAEELRKHLEVIQLPAPFIAALAEMDKPISEGCLSVVGDGFHKLTGKQPEDFEAWAKRNKHLFAF